MPIHDWSHVDPGLFHDFHQAWTIEIRNALNREMLPAGFFALAEQVISGPIPDVIALRGHGTPPALESHPRGAVTVADSPPPARFVTSADLDLYTSKANRIAIRHRLGHVVAVIEIVSPGIKNSRHALRSFVDKAQELLRRGIHLLVIDLFPPSPRDPQGIHKAIWDEIGEEPFELPPDKRLTVAAYSAGEPLKAYVEPVAVGDPLPSLPIFLDAWTYVPAPLEPTYQTTWIECPDAVKEVVEQSGSQNDGLRQ